MTRSVGSRVLSIFWSPSRTQVSLVLPLSIDEAERRLRCELNGDSSGAGVEGRVLNRGVALWLTRSASRSSFSPRFYGIIRRVDGKTRLDGHFQMNPVTRLFLVVWFALATLAAVGLLALALSQNEPERSAIDAIPFLLPPLVPLFGLLFVRRQQERGRRDEVRIKEWLEKAFKTPRFDS